jgi:hypothetical protein
MVHGAIFRISRPRSCPAFLIPGEIFERLISAFLSMLEFCVSSPHKSFWRLNLARLPRPLLGIEGLRSPARPIRELPASSCG